MNKIVKITVLAAAALAALAGAATVGLSADPVTYSHPESVPVASTPVPVPSENKYPSSGAWINAGPEQRAEAYAAMVGAVNAEQTCLADVAHSYRGLRADVAGEHYEMPSKLHPGQHHEFGEYAEGVCD
jgi:hypothetical protein